MPYTIVDAPRGRKRATVARKPRSSTKRRPKKKRVFRTNLVAKLDSVISTWNRTRYADKNGIVQCYTCPKKAPIKSMQNGHYVSRSVRKLRWEPDNMRPQCYGCNIMNGGQPITFRENLLKELGEPYVLYLESLRHELFKPTDEWLVTQIEAYTKLVDLSLRKDVIE